MQEMKYFNEGNDCDICKNQLMTGRDGTVEDCRRRQNGLSCRFEERDIRTCPVCEHEVDREDMYFTKDCHGIPFRLVCDRCYQRIMSKGYDGEYYTEADEPGSSRPSVWDDRPRIDKAGQNRRSDGWKSDVYCQPRQQSY